MCWKSPRHGEVAKFFQLRLDIDYADISPSAHESFFYMYVIWALSTPKFTFFSPRNISNRMICTLASEELLGVFNLLCCWYDISLCDPGCDEVGGWKWQGTWLAMIIWRQNSWSGISVPARNTSR